MAVSVPEVSLITSWHVEAETSGKPCLPGVEYALRENVNLLDLYFVEHSDIPWYLSRIAEKGRRKELQSLRRKPSAFVAALQPDELKRIAESLWTLLTNAYDGKLIGRRPRFAALATYFPHLSLPIGPQRDTAIRALRNTLFLAHHLGCRCVEIVGGAGVPGRNYTGTESPEEYRQSRMEALAANLILVYEDDREIPDNPLRREEMEGKIPIVAVELEPGVSPLLNRPKAFLDLRRLIAKRGEDCLTARSVYLNADIAHAFLIGYSPEEALFEQELASRIAHIHISDHAGGRHQGGAHASDLVPGIFHREAEYHPWLKFAINQMNPQSPSDGSGQEPPPSHFSGVVSIELEACNDPDMMLDARRIVQRWVRNAAQKFPLSDDGVGSDQKRGILLVVDIANSTEKHFGPRSGQMGSLRLRETIEQLCTVVHNHRGSTMSFTGDGFIALFEAVHFAEQGEAKRKALTAAQEICQAKYRGRRLVVRAALHDGEAYIPSSGRLRDQIIGEDVVLTTRLCAWLSQTIESSISPHERSGLIAVTEQWRASMLTAATEAWNEHREVEFKGLKGKHTVFWQRYP